MQKSHSANIRGFIREYRVGPLTGTTKEDLKNSKMSLINKQNQSKAMERSETLSKQSFYKDISRKTQAFSGIAPQESGSIRPFSNYMSLRPHTALKNAPEEHDRASMTEGIHEKEDSLKPRNHNLVAHFQRNFAEGSLQKNTRTQSAFNIRKPITNSSTKNQQEENQKNSYSQQNIIPRNIQSAAAHKQAVIEEEGAGQGESKSRRAEQSDSEAGSRDWTSHDSQAANKDMREVKRFFRKNPKNCLEHTLYQLEKCQELLGVADEEAEKRKENLRKEQMMMLTGRTDGAHPWDHISLYIGDEPEFNNPSYQGNYKREALLKVQEKDERELRMLLDEAEERLEFYKKHAAISYDNEFSYLKVTQTRLTSIEVEKVKEQFKSKAEG
jgi:hypothetical protein